MLIGKVSERFIQTIDFKTSRKFEIVSNIKLLFSTLFWIVVIAFISQIFTFIGTEQSMAVKIVPEISDKN